MSDENLYAELPADPEQAFLILEQRYRDECTQKINSTHENERIDIFYVDYIAQVLAAIKALGLETKFDTAVPKIEDTDYDAYLNFGKDVKYYRTMLEIEHGRRIQKFSVRFDAATKQKIRHHLTKVRNIVEKLEISRDKKAELLIKIGALEQEVDRDRTRFETYGALVIESAGVLGDAVDKLEPVRKWLDTIGRVFWGAKKEEDTKQLPPPAEHKRIEAPRAPQPSPKSDNLDDDIPF